MPIHALVDHDHGLLLQHCASCGARHSISMNRASLKARTGPVPLRDGDTLELRVDNGEPELLTLHAADFPDLANVSAAQLADVVRARLPRVRARDDAGGLLLESSTDGAASELEIIGGTACATLGLTAGARARRPELGLQIGDHADANIMELRRCGDCGAREFLVRTDDALDAGDVDTLFAAQRVAVNALANHAQRVGWTHAALAKRHEGGVASPAPPSRFPTLPLAKEPR